MGLTEIVKKNKTKKDEGIIGNSVDAEMSLFMEKYLIKLNTSEIKEQETFKFIQKMTEQMKEQEKLEDESFRSKLNNTMKLLKTTFTTYSMLKQINETTPLDKRNKEKEEEEKKLFEQLIEKMMELIKELLFGEKSDKSKDKQESMEKTISPLYKFYLNHVFEKIENELKITESNNYNPNHTEARKKAFFENIENMPKELDDNEINIEEENNKEKVKDNSPEKQGQKLVSDMFNSFTDAMNGVNDPLGTIFKIFEKLKNMLNGNENENELNKDGSRLITKFNEERKNNPPPSSLQGRNR